MDKIKIILGEGQRVSSLINIETQKTNNQHSQSHPFLHHLCIKNFQCSQFIILYVSHELAKSPHLALKQGRWNRFPAYPLFLGHTITLNSTVSKRPFLLDSLPSPKLAQSSSNHSTQVSVRHSSAARVLATSPQ